MWPGSLSAFLDVLHEWRGQATRSIKLTTPLSLFSFWIAPMASPSLEAKDFRVMELAPYPLLGATLLVAGSMG